MSGDDELATRTWPEIEAATVFVPLGSTEQHGPHLSLGTDTAIAVAVARGLVAVHGGLVAPEIAYGSSGEHEDFPGTVSIGAEALELLITEFGRSAMRWAARVVFVNGHGGNVGALAAAVTRLRREGRDVAWLPCGTAAPDPADTHAGRIETSVMAHLRPGDVRPDRMAAGETRPLDELLGVLRVAGMRAVAPTGVLGDPRGATAASGEVILAEMIATARARLEGTVDRYGCLQKVLT
ncbi:mycofactocin biosynthesis peptidyl-dipeptidase MftE [Microbacterium gorillae]|uniref:mycofactocin biosynthesis peptidyl-dipeptidase MftE n=1 Tax=Microbacterium gorillae TaxID=1231063 RepID=UPI00058B6F1C|nr:mycofactocin biosynthesis peptidyl-dipeptidase MftE [Microbacterium gorillae]